MILLAYIFPKLKTTLDLLGPMSKKIRFRRPSDSQYVKESQTLLESERQHFYHIFSSLYLKTDLENFSLSDMQNLRNLC